MAAKKSKFGESLSQPAIEPTIKNSYKGSDKLRIISQIEQGKKKKTVAEECNIPYTTVCDIYRNRAKIREKVSKFGGECKKARQCEFPETEKALLVWFDKQRDRNLPIDGKILLEKANHFSKTVNETPFLASQGWLTNWKKRNGITFTNVCGESGEVDQVRIDIFLYYS
jgi:hypothetical protein